MFIGQSKKSIWIMFFANHSWTFMVNKSIVVQCCDMREGSLEVKLPTIWRDGKTEVGGVSEEKESEEKEPVETRSKCAKR